MELKVGEQPGRCACEEEEADADDEDMDQLLAQELAALGPDPSRISCSSSSAWALMQPAEAGLAPSGNNVFGKGAQEDDSEDDNDEPDVFRALRDAVARRERFLTDVSQTLWDVQQELGVGGVQMVADALVVGAEEQVAAASEGGSAVEVLKAEGSPACGLSAAPATASAVAQNQHQAPPCTSSATPQPAPQPSQPTQLLAAQQAAAAQRAAARTAQLQELAMRASEHGRRCIAASRITRSWRQYRGSAPRAARLAAVTRLQAAVRGMAARRRCAQLRQARDALVAVWTALEAAATATAVATKLSEAAAAGVGAEAEAAVASFRSGLEAAGRGLQEAAHAGSYAAYAAAHEAAARYVQLASQVCKCQEVFRRRQARAWEALSSAVASAPARLAAAAAELATELGVPAAQVTAAIEQARTRNARAAADVAAAAAVMPFDAAALEQAVATCNQLGLGADATAARVVVERRRHAALAQLWGVCTLGDVVVPAQVKEKGATAAAATAAASKAGEQHIGSASTGAAAQQVIANCRALGLLPEAFEAERRLQVACTAALQHLRDATSCSTGAEAAAALQRALGMGVGAEEVEGAMQRLHERQESARIQLMHGAQEGSISEFLQAYEAAAVVGVDSDHIKQEAVAFQSRRQASAKQLASAARACCTVLRATAASTDVLTLCQDWCCQAQQSAGLLAGLPNQQLLPSAVTDAMQHLATCDARCTALGATSSIHHAWQAVASLCQELQAGASSVVAQGCVLQDGDQALVMPPPWEGAEAVEVGDAFTLSCSSRLPDAGCVQQARLEPSAARQWRTQCQAAKRKAASCSEVTAQPAGAVEQIKACEPAPPPVSSRSCPNTLLAAKVQVTLGGSSSNLLTATELDMSLEQVESIQGLASYCPNLRVLRLDGNHLSSLEGVADLSQLRDLHAQVRVVLEFETLSADI